MRVGCVLFIYILAILTFTEGVARGEDECTFDPNGILFISSLGDDGHQSDQALRDELERRLAGGIADWNRGSVVTEQQVRANSRQELDGIRLLNSFLRIPTEHQLRGLVRAPNAPLTSLVTGRLMHFGSRTSLEVRLYSLCKSQAGRSRLLAIKTRTFVRSEDRTSGDEGEFLRGAAQALGSRLNRFEKKPVLNATVDSKSGIVGHRFKLQATASDEDFDDLAFTWENDQVAILESTGDRATLSAQRAGNVRVTVKACQTANGNVCESATVDLTVVDAPRVTVKASEVVSLEFDTPSDTPQRGAAPAYENAVVLAGSCESCTSSSWSQVEGPTVALNGLCKSPPSENGQRVENTCRVPISEPGAYKFRYSGQNRTHEASAVQSVLVIARPKAWIWAPEHVLAGRSYELDGSSSYQLTGSPLKYRWEISRRPFVDSLTTPRQEPNDDVRLKTPTRSNTEIIVAYPERAYFARLCVTSSVPFEGRDVSSTSCSSRPIHSRKAQWMPALTGGSYFNFDRKDGRTTAHWDGFNLHFMLSVRWPSQSLGFRFNQVLLRSDRRTNELHLGSLTSVGLAWLRDTSVQPYLAFYGTWNDNLWGPEGGVDFRINEYLLVATGVRYNLGSDGLFGAGVAFGGGMPL